MMDDFIICEKDKCCGCGACAQICPVQAILMESDSEGFLYPKISEQCTRCQKCKTVCPKNNTGISKGNVCETYAIQIQDRKLLKQSTSGGVFILLAKYVLDRNGVVFGARYDENMVVKHAYAEKMEDVFPMQGSKYVQSDTNKSYQQAQCFLQNGRYVLFSGTPCQIEGLLSYLKDEYEKLILLDIICGGTPSPLLFRKYLEYTEKKHRSKIINYKFRDKTEFGCSHTTVIIEYKKKKIMRTVIPDRTQNSYYVAFGEQAFSRPACYGCIYNTVNRKSDFTCGGYFGENDGIKAFGEIEGISEIIIHTVKGLRIFEDIKSETNWMLISIEDAKEGNQMLYSSAPANLRQPEMFDCLLQSGYKKTAKKYFPVKKYAKIKRLIPLSVKNRLAKFLIK